MKTLNQLKAQEDKLNFRLGLNEGAKRERAKIKEKIAKLAIPQHKQEKGNGQ